MKLDHHSRLGAFLIGVAGRLARWILFGLGRSWTHEIVDRGGHLARLLAEPHPVILSFWHNRAVAASDFFYNRLHRGGLDVILLASQSRDGELVTQVCKRWGIPTVRGSATRGGRQALRAIHRAITRRGSSPIMVPDGPQGPTYRFKVGVAVLAQTSGAPILPLGFAARRFWRLESWDRLIIPWPFTKIAVVVGEPVPLPKTLSADQLEAERARLETMLNDLTAEAETAAGLRAKP